MNPQKDITIYDIAEKLNLSSATVSRALSDNKLINKNTRKKVLDTAKAMGYRHNTFASSLRKQKTNTIGVVMHEVNSYFMTSVLAGIEKVTTEAGYDLLIAHSSESYEKEKANAENLFHRRVDGIIASMAFDTKNLEHYEPFVKKGIPFVFYDRVDENSDFTKVIIDNYKSGYNATKHLIQQGCKRIALVTGSLLRNVYQQRMSGYQAALKDFKIPFKKEMVIVRDLSPESATAAAKIIMKMKPIPDGIFVTHDFSAAVIMQTLKNSGYKIPKDIAIVGFNNDIICQLIEPQLSTINYPGKEIGEIAARTLVNHLKGIANISQMKTIIINSEFIIRASSQRNQKQL
jgi:LacI family transcriptional regulator